jgi:hypothetical protein
VASARAQMSADVPNQWHPFAAGSGKNANRRPIDICSLLSLVAGERGNDELRGWLK